MAVVAATEPLAVVAVVVVLAVVPCGLRQKKLLLVRLV